MPISALALPLPSTPASKALQSPYAIRSRHLADLGIRRNVLPAMCAAGADMQISRDARDGEPARVLDVLVAEDVELADLDVGRGQVGGVGEARGRRVGRDASEAVAAGGLHVGDRVARHGGPGGQVVIVAPDHEGHERRVGRDVAVVQHRVDEDLFGEGRGQVAVAGYQGGRRRDAAAAAVAHHGDAGRVHVELDGVVVQPAQARETVFGQGWAALLLSQISVSNSPSPLMQKAYKNVPREQV